MRTAALLLLLVLAAGCGSSGRSSEHGSSTQSAAETATPRTTLKRAPSAANPGFQVGVVGPVQVDDARVRVRHGPLARLAADAQLVVVSGRPKGLAAAAAANPDTSFALVGASHTSVPGANVAGILFREDQAGYLAGVVAGLVLTSEGGHESRVAWVGPRDEQLATAFARGAHAVDPSVTVLRGWSQAAAAACKEAALAAIARSATVVFSGRGRCTAGARAAAAQQNAVGLSLSDFERPEVALEEVLRDAAAGRFHGGEDLVYGADTGAVGVRRLDPSIGPEVLAQARAVEQELATGLRAPR